MGRIKSTLVKRTSKQLLKHEEIVFTNAFNDNKKILGNTMPSKKIRNKIAGYIARLQRAKLDAEKRAQRKARRDAEKQLLAQETPEYQFSN